MKAKKQGKLIIGVLFLFISLSFGYVTALGAATEPLTKIDAAAQPYQKEPDTYLISENASMSWKYFNTILGYNEAGTQKSGTPTVKVYEYRSKDTAEQKLQYAWTFYGEKLKPITGDVAGPVSLSVSVKAEADDTVVEFGCKRDFKGTAGVKLYVGDYFKDQDRLTLTYLGGSDSSDIHGPSKAEGIASSVIIKDLTVVQGYIEFDLGYGGTYSLSKETATAAEPDKTAVPDKAAVNQSIDTSAVSYQGNGSKEEPFTYLISSGSKLTWKKYNTVLGYDDNGLVKGEAAVTETYENRVGDLVDGKLNYAWTIDGTKLLPITENNKGPINLGITCEKQGSSVKVSFDTTRVFDGEIYITLDVSKYFEDQDMVVLEYSTGAGPDQIHGTDTATDTVTAKSQELKVEDGLVKFTIHNGGNYVLNKESAGAIEVVSKDSGTPAKDNDTTITDIKADTNNIKADAAETDPSDDELPKTGEIPYSSISVIMMILFGTGVILLRVRREKWSK